MVTSPGRLRSLALVVALAPACGSDDGTRDAGFNPEDGLTLDGPTGMALTSTALAPGAAIAAAYTCNGANVSLPLRWTAGPSGSSSYAVVLTDQRNALLHWIIYDIPAATTALPEDVDHASGPADVPGAHQTTGYDDSTFGYLGPCPPAQHTYQFAVFALDVATLPGTSATTSRAQAKALIDAHDLASATLTGTYAQVP